MARGACPTTAEGRIPRSSGGAAGAGPVFLQGFTSDGLLYLGAMPAGGGAGVNLRLFVGPNCAGPIVLREARLDGGGRIRFAPPEAAEVRLAIEPVSPPDWWVVPLRDVGLSGPGCYAIRADGLDFSEVVVFAVVAGAVLGASATPQP